jgi:hypothetical protein
LLSSVSWRAASYNGCQSEFGWSDSITRELMHKRSRVQTPKCAKKTSPQRGPREVFSTGNIRTSYRLPVAMPTGSDLCKSHIPGKRHRIRTSTDRGIAAKRIGPKHNSRRSLGFYISLIDSGSSWEDNSAVFRVRIPPGGTHALSVHYRFFVS